MYTPIMLLPMTAAAPVSPDRTEFFRLAKVRARDVAQFRAQYGHAPSPGSSLATHLWLAVRRVW